MADAVPTSVTTLDHVIDWFIPPELATQRDTRQRARMFLISHLFGPFIGLPVLGVLWWLDPAPDWDLPVLAVAMTSFWAYPFVLKATSRYNLLSFLSIQNLIFIILFSCYFNGGVQSPTLPWVVTIPLLTFFYLGPSSSLRPLVIMLYVIDFSVFFALCARGLPTPRTPLTSLQGLGIISTIAAALYVTMMALYYAKILASGVELEAEMRRHLVTAAELRRATSEAERAGAAKGDFLAKMSHELRTPLNAIIGYSQMLLEDSEAEGDDATSTDLRRIHGSGDHLLCIINDILDLSKIEAGKMEVSCERFDLHRLIERVVDRFSAPASRAHLQLDWTGTDTSRWLKSDPYKIEEVLDHLVSNALKFTKTGSVSIRTVRAAGSSSGVIVRIVDTGPGIAAERLGALFESFDGSEPSTFNTDSGAGLGLALSQKLCGLLGGSITVESELDVGTSFIVTLPDFAPDDHRSLDLPDSISAAFIKPKATNQTYAAAV
jgi:signal transduction histidine kinase